MDNYIDMSSPGDRVNHAAFDQLHAQLLTLLDRIDVSADDLAVDTEDYGHQNITDGIRELTHLRFDIMESFGYKLTDIRTNQDGGKTH